MVKSKSFPCKHVFGAFLHLLSVFFFVSYIKTKLQIYLLSLMNFLSLSPCVD
jgi:hypothetical protein